MLHKGFLFGEVIGETRERQQQQQYWTYMSSIAKKLEVFDLAKYRKPVTKYWQKTSNFPKKKNWIKKVKVVQGSSQLYVISWSIVHLWSTMAPNAD